jgi:hypothetical protein
MLSLPDEWDFTLAGLSAINREKVDAIREAVRELERARYITRSRMRNSKGQLTSAEYVIYEKPQEVAPEPEPPTLDFPILDYPTLENPTLGNPMQLNKDRTIKERLSKDQSIGLKGKESNLYDLIESTRRAEPCRA